MPALGFVSVAGSSVSNRPIWLVEAPRAGRAILGKWGDSLSCVALGAGKALEEIKTLRDVVVRMH